ncbi:MAG: hypothetical protein IPM35_13445 [Myxococcales bacterium]|nr:hypothetical protein [Myxococcales bacterium]
MGTLRFLLCFACGVSCAAPKPNAPPSPEVTPVPPSGSVDPAKPPSARPAPARVRGGAVDDIVVGAPIPARHLDDKARYEARWVADAQPMEGFLIGNPPVWVTLDKGPMDEVEPGPIEELLPALAPKALAAARAGALVDAIVIEHPGITTAEGIGVGSTYQDLRDVYGEIEIVRNPEWLDSKPTCDARAKNLPGIRFLLDGCKQGEPPGPVKRLLVGKP